MRLRKLNTEGLNRFEEWLADGAPGETPLALAKESTTSVPIPYEINLSLDKFSDRFVFGKYLVDALAPLDSLQLSSDRALWTTLALIWFDQICPNFANGGRRLVRDYHYILSTNYRHYYRHLVRSPWQLVRDNGEAAKFLLLPRIDNPYPLMRHGELIEQISGRQSVLRNRSIISAASQLYSDPKSGRPFRGVAGRGRGSVNRFGMVLKQLDLTFDIEGMKNGKLLGILPTEFDRWKGEIKSTAE